MKNEKVEQFIDGYLKRFVSAKTDKWNYEDGCVLKGVQMMYNVTKDAKYKEFILEYLKKYIKMTVRLTFTIAKIITLTM